ncbi:hypothetical protein Pyn_07767 [Prunus yedoensis var. nudiflora]|uniref:Uncharacterized protein n=1 Tax=Prunus yedoensis var. nudiflora TaxID=2094558 RepID=A0A314UU20_PRUYE|nr:hypothetical protein Pyn_07767 [Prunus yedoensis var. nudiflora]
MARGNCWKCSKTSRGKKTSPYAITQQLGQASDRSKVESIGRGVNSKPYPVGNGYGDSTKNLGAQDRAISSAAQGRKRSREVMATEAAHEAEVAETVAEAGKGAQAIGAMAEEEVVEPPRKRLLFVLLEGENEEEVPPVMDDASDAKAVAGEAPDAEAAISEPIPVSTAGSPPVMTIVPASVAIIPTESPPAVICHSSSIMIRSTVLAFTHGCHYDEPASYFGRHVPNSRAVSRG